MKQASSAMLSGAAITNQCPILLTKVLNISEIPTIQNIKSALPVLIGNVRRLPSLNENLMSPSATSRWISRLTRRCCGHRWLRS